MMYITTRRGREVISQEYSGQESVTCFEAILCLSDLIMGFSVEGTTIFFFSVSSRTHTHSQPFLRSDFGDGVNNVFEENYIADCTFDTIDSGGFYTCGQRGTAFTNRGNVLRGNKFERIRNTAGLGVQIASNQAVYLDDQMSAWVVENNSFVDCQIAMFVGGGRRNLFLNNQCERCGTVFYINNQGMFGNFDNPTVNCTTISPPFETTCSTGAAEWMTTHAPASEVWVTTWPEMRSIRSDYLGYPAHTELINSTYCCAKDADICELLSSNTDMEQVESWKVNIEGNVRDDDC